MHWLYLYQGKVVHQIDKDDAPTPDDWPGNSLYDTIAIDDSKVFKVGDEFTADLQLEYNREIWTERGWITASGDASQEIS